MVRTLLTLSVLALFSMAVAGCRMEGEVGEDADTSTRVRDNDGSSYKKTTTVEPDGDRKVTIEENR